MESLLFVFLRDQGSGLHMKMQHFSKTLISEQIRNFFGFLNAFAIHNCFIFFKLQPVLLLFTYQSLIAYSVDCIEEAWRHLEQCTLVEACQRNLSVTGPPGPPGRPALEALHDKTTGHRLLSTSDKATTPQIYPSGQTLGVFPSRRLSALAQPAG